MTFNILLLTGEQIRAARALSRIEQTDLARRATLSLETIKRLERIRGPVEANARTLRAIQRAFEEIGISFQGYENGIVGVVKHPCPKPEELPRPNLSLKEQSRHSSAQRLRRLIYHAPLRPAPDGSLRPILSAMHKQALNLHHDLGLTGLTLIEGGVVLQAIEGEHHAVETAYQMLKATSLTQHIQLLDDRMAGQRVFTDMGFCCGLFVEDSRSHFYRSAQPDFTLASLTGTEAIARLMAARKRQDETPRNGCLVPASCALSNLCMDYQCSNKPHHLASQNTPQAQ